MFLLNISRNRAGFLFVYFLLFCLFIYFFLMSFFFLKMEAFSRLNPFPQHYSWIINWMSQMQFDDQNTTEGQSCIHGAVCQSSDTAALERRVCIHKRYKVLTHRHEQTLICMWNCFWGSITAPWRNCCSFLD